MSIPRVIHTLWFQGEPNAPEIVRVCFNRWRALNPEYELKIYDLAQVKALLGNWYLLPSLTHQALSDIFRARLLLQEGGIWVDATVYPVQPLAQWLPDATAKTGFFAFSNPGPDRAISSWFLAVAPNHPMMQTWWQEISRFWSGPRVLASYSTGYIPPNPVETVSPQGSQAGFYPYFWFHYLFQYAVETHPDFKSAWAECIKLPSLPNHALQNLVRSTPAPTAEQIAEALVGTTVQKLDWRLEYQMDLLRRAAS